MIFNPEKTEECRKCGSRADEAGYTKLFYDRTLTDPVVWQCAECENFNFETKKVIEK